MDPVYLKIQKRAREIVARFPQPEFYRRFPEANEFSCRHFNDNRHIQALKQIVDTHIDNSYGHGLQHAVKVTLDAGALIVIEGRRMGYPQASIERLVLLVQCAGLLHDIRRKQPDHAAAGADFSRKILADFPLTETETGHVCSAIRNHEAFKKVLTIESGSGELISDCLYDADKFRWGPDNFTDTLWDMIALSNPPLSVFVEKWPGGMAGLEKIKLTFRTRTGIRYGPEFIDIGIAVGKKLYRVILAEHERRSRD